MPNPLSALSAMASEMLEAANRNDWTSVDRYHASISTQLLAESPVSLCTKYPTMTNLIIADTQRLLDINVAVESMIKANMANLTGLKAINGIEQKLNRAYAGTT